MKMKIFFSSIILVAIMAACTHPAVPEDAQKESRLPHIYPDYTEVTIPCNICPLNFAVRENASEVVARFTFPGGEIAYGKGQNVLIDEEEWELMLKAAKGKSMQVEVFAKEGERWKAYKPFNIYVAKDSIDSYISYRVI